MEMPFQPNEGKNLEIDTDYGRYARYPVKTHVITKDDVLEDVLDKYVREYIQPGDTIIMSEKIVAISQGRAFPIEEIKVSRLAKILSHFVVKTNYGIGLGMPETMELCIREVGRVKVLWAAFCAAIGKLFGKHGVFYNICGMRRALSTVRANIRCRLTTTMRRWLRISPTRLPKGSQSTSGWTLLSSTRTISARTYSANPARTCPMSSRYRRSRIIPLTSALSRRLSRS